MKKSFLILLISFISHISYAQGVLSNIPGNFYIDLGLVTLKDTPNDLDLHSQSRGISVSYMYELTLGSEKFTFHPGLSYGHESYFFRDSKTIVKQDGGVTLPVAFNDVSPYDAVVRKSKLAVNYIDIPLEFRFRTHPGRNAFRIGLGVKGGYMFDSHTKVKYRVNNTEDVRISKDKGDFNLNSWRAGATARIGYGMFNIFGYIGFNRLFKQNAIPNFDGDDIPIMLGLTLSSF